MVANRFVLPSCLKVDSSFVRWMYSSVFLCVAVWGSAQPVAVATADSLIRQLDTITHPKQKIKTYINIGYNLYAHDSARAVRYARLAMQNSRRSGLDMGIAEGYNVLALVHDDLGYLPRSLSYYDSAFHYYRQADNLSGKLAALSNGAETICKYGNCAEAIERYLRAEKLLDTAAVEQPTAKRLTLRIGRAYCLLNCEMYEACIDLSSANLPLTRQPGNRYFLSYWHLLLADSHAGLTRIDSALYHYDRAEMNLTEDLAALLLPDIVAGRARQYVTLGQYERARGEMLRSVDLNAQLNRRRQDARTWIALGDLAQKRGEYRESLDYYNYGLEQLEDTDDHNQLSAAYESAARASYRAGLADLGYLRMERALSLRDSFLTESMRRNTQELNVRYETERVQKELAESRLQIEKERHRRRLLLFGAIGALVLAGGVASYFLQRQRRRRAEVEKRKIELEYGLLRAQMNPHFVFNSLNSIQGYFANNRFEAGNEFLGKFSRLIRRILDQSSEPQISLAEELETLAWYLDLERVRLKNQLDYTFHYDPDLETDLIRVPPLILQPFVENAIWHGIAPKQQAGRVDIYLSTNATEDILEARITDDGVGLRTTENQNGHQSKGIQITKERLGMRSRVEVRNRSDAPGVEVELHIPV